MNLLDTRLRLAERALRYCTEGISVISDRPGSLDVPNGWVDLIDQMLGQLLALPAEDHPRFSCIRRWDGKLDFRWSEGSGAADRIMSAARARAAHTCELCGATARLISTPVGMMTLCKGHADMDLTGRNKIEIQTALSTSASFARPKVLMMLRKRPGRDVWVLLERDEELEFSIDDANWLVGWLEGTNECADLYAIDSLRDIEDLYHLLNRAGIACRLTLREARAILLWAAMRRCLRDGELDRLSRRREHWNHEARIAAHSKLAGLFELGCQ